MGMLKTSHGARKPPGSFTSVVFPYLSSAFIPALDAWVLEAHLQARVLQGDFADLTCRTKGPSGPVDPFGLVLCFRK